MERMSGQQQQHSMAVAGWALGECIDRLRVTQVRRGRECGELEMLGLGIEEVAAELVDGCADRIWVSHRTNNNPAWIGKLPF
jgi:hypothetical protein